MDLEWPTFCHLLVKNILFELTLTELLNLVDICLQMQINKNGKCIWLSLTQFYKWNMNSLFDIEREKVWGIEGKITNKNVKGLKIF